MRKTINYPFESEYKKFECYFRIYKPDNNGDINITLRLNVINDKNTYRWTYGNIKDYNVVGEDAFFEPLKVLLNELYKLKYCWEWEGGQENKRYILGSNLIWAPVYNGDTNKIRMNSGDWIANCSRLPNISDMAD